MNTEQLSQKVFGRPWFHRIDLGGGIITPGVDNSPSKLQYMHLPEDLTGKSVLDIGAYDGFFSFEAERRGARRVVATDQYCWKSTGMGDGEGFKIAHDALGSRVEAKVIPVERYRRRPWECLMWFCSWECSTTRRTRFATFAL